MDIDLLQQQLNGYEAKGKELRKDEGAFLKVQGLREQEEKARIEITTMESDVQGLKEEISEVEFKRNEKMTSLCRAIENSMDNVLPSGNAVVNINSDGSVFIGWNLDGSIRPQKALSGGETVAFNLALSHALGAGILLVESAEMDDIRMSDQLGALNQFDGQVIVSTCHKPKGTIPEGWDVVNLEANNEG